VRDYAQGDGWAWNTQGLSAGKYSVQVDMRTVGSAADREAFQAIPYELMVSPVGIVTLDASASGSQVAGTQVTFNASVSGGGSSVQYRYWLRKAGEGWQVVREFAADNSWRWDTTGLASGTYSVRAGARAGGLDSGESFSLPRVYPITSPTVTSVSVAATVPSPMIYSTPVTFTASAREGIGPIQYRFRLYLPQIAYSRFGTTVLVRDYSPANTWTWDNSASYADENYTPATFLVEVSARSDGSAMDNEAIQTLLYRVVVPPVTDVSFSVSPGSPAPRGTRVLMSALATGGITPYRYSFQVRNAIGFPGAGTGSDCTTFTWDTTQAVPGDYTFEVRVASFGSDIDNEVRQVIPYQLIIVQPDNVLLSASPTSPHPAGGAVTITAQALGGVAPYRYSFTIRNQAGTLIESRYFTPDNTYQWNTYGLPAGSYTVEVLASCSFPAGSDSYATLQTMPYQLQNPVVDNVSLSASLSSPLVVGPDVTFTATASGGLAPIQYRFTISNSVGTVIADYPFNTANSFVWPTRYEPYNGGTYTIAVYARSNGSTSGGEASRAVPYVLDPRVTVVAPTIFQPGARAPGITVGMTAAAGGGVQPHQYRLRIRNGVGGSQVALWDYSTNNNWLWNTTGLPNGSYSLEFCARSAGSVMDNDACATNYSYTLQPAISGLALATTPSVQAARGVAVLLSASASGGVSPYRYQFAVKNSSGTKVVDMTYGTSSVYSWETWMLPLGSYTVEAQAISSGSGADNEAVTTLPFQLINPPVTGVTLSASPGSPQGAGTSVTFAATASGGTAPLQYRFRIRNGSGTVIATQAYGASATYAWSTTALSAATYTAEVSAKSSGSPLDNEAVGTTNYTLFVPVSSVSLAGSPASPQNRGTTVTFTGTASGGTAPYQYQFIVKNSGGVTVATRAYGASNSYSWPTSGLAKGTYTIEVDARSNGSTSNREAFKTMSYTLR
jgi:hypothetical protein